MVNSLTSQFKTIAYINIYLFTDSQSLVKFMNKKINMIIMMVSKYAPTQMHHRRNIDGINWNWNWKTKTIFDGY